MKDNLFLCSYCSRNSGYNVYHSDYHKTKEQRDKLRELLIDAWNVLDCSEPNHPITEKILAALEDTEADGDNS